MARNSNIKFYMFIQCVEVRLCAKQNLIDYNDGEPPSDFRTLKNVCAEIPPLYQNNNYQ